MGDTALLVLDADPAGPEAMQLVRELSEELGARYRDSGEGAFEPADAKVPRSAFLVAKLEGEPVGCGALRPYGDQEPHVAEIKRMYVKPAVRGRGVSRSILAKLESLARGFGYSVIRLETGLLQPEAIHLYVKAGYTRIARYGIYTQNTMSACFEKKIGA
jgi:putative acetyltransferase